MNSSSDRSLTKRVGVALAAAVTGVLLFAGPAAAQYVSPSSSVNVPPDDGTDTSVEPTVGGTQVERTSPGGTLPFTGGDVAGLAAIGAAALAGGLVLTAAHRRRTAEVTTEAR